MKLCKGLLRFILIKISYNINKNRKNNRRYYYYYYYSYEKNYFCF